VDNGEQSLALKGYFGANYVHDKHVDEIKDNSSRVGLHFNHLISDNLAAFAVLEMGVDIVNNNKDLEFDNGDGLREVPNQDDSIWTRLGYLGAKHDKWGSVSIGKQWSPYYLATEATDVFEIYGGQASGTFNFNTDGGFSGTGRAKQALKYQGEYGPLTFAVQIQANNDEIELKNIEGEKDASAKFDRGLAVGALYAYKKLAVALAYSKADIAITQNKVQSAWDYDESVAASIAYGSLDAEGVYAAITYNQSKNHEVDDQNHFIDATGIEAYIGYGLNENINFYGGMNKLTPKNVAAANKYKVDYYLVGAKYLFSDIFKVFTEYKINNSLSFSGEKKDSRIGIGAIYSF
jgi:predicted porin